MQETRSPSTAQAALRGLCPRCGGKGLFVGLVAFAPQCERCALDFRQFNVGDGPAAFLIFLISPLVIIAAVSLEFAKSPPFWVHILLWTPITTALVIGSLRIAKAALLALEYRDRAAEGRLVE